MARIDRAVATASNHRSPTQPSTLRNDSQAVCRPARVATAVFAIRENTGADAAERVGLNKSIDGPHRP